MGMDWTLREGYCWAEDKEHCEENGRMLSANASKVSVKAKKRGLPQVTSTSNDFQLMFSWALLALETTMVKFKLLTKSTTNTQPERWGSITWAKSL
jgi:hypothetical protein